MFDVLTNATFLKYYHARGPFHEPRRFQAEDGVPKVAQSQAAEVQAKQRALSHFTNPD